MVLELGAKDKLVTLCRQLHQSHEDLGAFVAWPDDIRPGTAAPHPHAAAQLFETDPGIRNGPFENLVAQLIHASPKAHWRETYKGTRLYDEIMHRFGCYEVIGYDGLARSEKMRSFIVYMPAGFHYPWHEHPAEELYLVLAGTATFQQEGRKAHQVHPGETVFHPSGAAHATTTTGGPVLCYVVWRDHFDSPPVWSAL